MFPWHLFPLLVQAIAVAAALPSLAKLVQHKRSDQRALVDHWLMLCAQLSMVVWAHAWARQPALVASTSVGILMTILSASLILHYRRHPGGRHGPIDARARPSRLHPARPFAPGAMPVA